MKKLLLATILIALVIFTFLLFKSNQHINSKKKNTQISSASKVLDISSEKHQNAKKRNNIDEYQKQLKIKNLVSNLKTNILSSDRQEPDGGSKQKTEIIRLEEFEEAFTKLDKILESEGKNELWTSDISDSTSNGLEREKYTGTALSTVLCGDSLCKIIFSHEDMSASVKFLGKKNAGFRWANNNHFGLVRPNDSGGLETVFYVAKEGERLPVAQHLTQNSE